jgi:hypothetical protein
VYTCFPFLLIFIDGPQRYRLTVLQYGCGERCCTADVQGPRRLRDRLCIYERLDGRVCAINTTTRINSHRYMVTISTVVVPILGFTVVEIVTMKRRNPDPSTAFPHRFAAVRRSSCLFTILKTSSPLPSSNFWSGITISSSWGLVCAIMIHNHGHPFTSTLSSTISPNALAFTAARLLLTFNIHWRWTRQSS